MKFKCSICGHIYDEEKEGVKFADLPDDWKCPICKQPKSKFEPLDETAELTWASEHKIGIASDLDAEMKEFLRAEFAGECSEVRRIRFPESPHGHVRYASDAGIRRHCLRGVSDIGPRRKPGQCRLGGMVRGEALGCKRPGTVAGDQSILGMDVNGAGHRG